MRDHSPFSGAIAVPAIVYVHVEEQMSRKVTTACTRFVLIFETPACASFGNQHHWKELVHEQVIRFDSSSYDYTQYGL